MKLTIQDGRDSFYTFDSNRILLLTATDEEQIKQVEFSTEEAGGTETWTKDVLEQEDGVKFVQVPNEFLNGDYTRLVCYAVALDSKGEFTRQKEVFRIKYRPQPEDWFLTYSERITFASIKALTEQYKSNASDSAELASKYAENNEDVAVESGKYSAKHWSIKSNKKYEEIRSYVGSASDPESALGSIESARANAVSDVEKQETDSIEAVGTYTSNTAIPSVSQYVEGTAKPALKTYGEQQVDSYVNGTSKPELDRYVNNEKKQVLDEYTAEKKTELDIYTSVDKKQVLDSYTENEKKTELDSHTVGLKEQLDAHAVARAGDLNEHTTNLKGTLDGYTTAKEQDISEFTEQKKQEVQGVYQTDLNELKGDLGEFGNTIEYEKTIINPFNRFDKSKIISGYRMSSTGQIYEDTSGTYCVSDFCDVSDLNSVKTGYAVNTNVNTPYSVYFALYNADKVQVSYGNAGTGDIDSINAKYFRAGIPLNRIDGFMLVDSTIDIVKYEPYFEPYEEIKAKRIDDIEESINNINKQKIGYHVGRDREYTSFSKAVNEALKHANSVVYVDNGVYDIKAEFEEIYGSNFFSSFTSTSRRGLYLGNGIKIILSPNAIIKFHYDGDNADVKERFSPFNFAPYSEYSSANYSVNGFEIIGGQIDVKNARYCSHDDPSSFNKEYINKYKNVCMKLDNTENLVWGSHACIGAGVGMYGTFEVESCVFESVGSKDTTCSISVHNTEQPNARSFISIKDNYLYGNNTIRLLWFGTSELKTKAIVCGNSVSRQIELRANTTESVNENIELLAWNNEIRN